MECPQVSSKGFETVLVPTVSLRRLLLASSACATLTGIGLIGSMPLRPALKTLFALLWVSRGLLEMVSQARGMSRMARLRMTAVGAVEALSAGGKAEPLELLPGSVVLSRVAWLRFRFSDGLQYGELLSGNARQDDGWRRLQVVWRQQATVFGGPRRS